MSHLTPEQQARQTIDKLLEAAGWHVCDLKQANIHAHKGLAIREFPLQPGYGTADYMLYVQGRAAGVLEAKREGATLSGVETQSGRYAQGLPGDLPCWHNPLPFAYESTGVETHFTNGLDPEPRARTTFAFHRPETLAEWLDVAASRAAESAPEWVRRGPTFLSRLRVMPALKEEGLWPAQIRAIKNLEASLADNRPRSLVQMATGSGKTFTAVSLVYRLLKFAGARRVLFLVDRGNLGKQTFKEFQQYVSPYNNFTFTQEFIVQRLTSNTLDTTARVCIGTIQRLYAMLRGEELEEGLEEESTFGLDRVFRDPRPVEYYPNIPIETFDVVITDECHRSIYNLWRQVLEYFDAHLIGLTATPSKQTFGFFHQNLVMEYGHEQAVADGVNVNYDVYRIRTAITQKGSTIEAGYYVDKRDRETRAVRWEKLDDDFAYDPNQLDRDVVSDSQIRTVIRTFRDKLFGEIFPGRTEVPKTLIFAKDDSHAEDIVRIVREEFGKGNEFAQKITYRTTGETPDSLIAAFRNSFNPRIAVTVDMIATGTDIKPLEIALFMRAVKSRTFFEQMKGRGVRVIHPDDLRGVTPDARCKDRYVIVDAVGVCERDLTDSRPMEKKPTVTFEKLLQAIALGNVEDDVLSSAAARIARMEQRLPPDDQKAIADAAGGLTLKDLAGRLVHALDPDVIVEAASRRWDQEIAASCRFLNPYAPVDIRQATLPHWRQDEVTYFVTFRLADSLPAEKLRAWRRERDAWLNAHPKPWDESEQQEYYKRFPRQLEQWLDNGCGGCILAKPPIKELVAGALRHFDRKRYWLGKFVVASNHVHVLVTPLPGYDLSDILHSWKSYTAKEILKVQANVEGNVEAASRRLEEENQRQDAAATTIWQKEYYDHILRSPEELYNIELYIERHTEYETPAFEELLQRQDAAATACYEAAARAVKREAATPLYDPKLRDLLCFLKRKNEQTLDTVSQDQVLEAGFSVDDTERAKNLVQSFEQFIKDNQDEITALQVLYSAPYRARLRYEDIRALADAIHEPPRLWRVDAIWKAYAALEKSKVRGASAPHIMTDLVSLVRFALRQRDELVPYPDLVEANFQRWLEQQRVQAANVEAASRRLGEDNQRQDAAATKVTTASYPFTDDQMKWLTMIKDHIAGSLSIEADDFDYSPFAQEGGLGRAYQLFGEQLNPILQQLNEGLIA